ncbi:putative colanic acid biosynthesis acetyltransferase WcaF [Gillisia mitskevichiae]|uniref:Putative colanic acid biosynthesis acetyltransferase WcaF n=1 Tax=Gillisia mitskevichiae TaxID=270921 RepID=A0A495PTK3_9FLAO|nr:putative colanic acid biosynthesis acetyltransferase [Gillisia mitskevichiae]RKS53943.1 putative colanic acid biosynthesis acetyltransferase WcaF [Gillisia mitskevichiae]
MKEQLLINLTAYNSSFSFSNKLKRLTWNLAYYIFFRPFNLGYFKDYRAFVLRLFGAKIGKNSHIYASVKIWAPWNLEIGENSIIGPKVDCYNQGKITIGNQTVISQKTYLCASSHDYKIFNFPLIKKPIQVMDQVWIAADAFIGPGSFIEQGAVVAARSAVFGRVDSWTVVRGNPATYVKNRNMTEVYNGQIVKNATSL